MYEAEHRPSMQQVLGTYLFLQCCKETYQPHAIQDGKDVQLELNPVGLNMSTKLGYSS